MLAAAMRFASDDANQDAMQAFAAAFGPGLPANATSTQMKVINGTPPVAVSKPNYDEGNDGMMSVPGSEGTASIKDVLDQSDPAKFINDNLCFGKGEPGDPLTLFVPGLNTPKAEAQLRLEHYVRGLAGLKPGAEQIAGRCIAQVHMGTDQDQGKVQFTLTPEVEAMLQAKRPQLEAAGIAPQIEHRDGQIFATFAPGQRDRVKAALVSAGVLETPVMKSIQGFLRTQLEGAGGPKKLNLMLYSRGSIDGAAAIASWIQDYTKRNAAKLGDVAARAKAQQLLKDNVMVETFGNASRKFPDGPKYIHWSATNDPLASGSGSTALNPQGGGKDAAYIHYVSPFKGFDAHNFGAGGVAFTRLVMELNNTRDPRKLYDLARSNELKKPDQNQLNTRIEKIDGKNWLWNPQVALAP